MVSIRTLVPLLILSSGCALSPGLNTPVVYQRGMPLHMPPEIRRAAATINERLGCEVFNVPEENHVRRDGVNVLYNTQSNGGQARKGALMCSVYVGSKFDAGTTHAIAVHELLHCLGQQHVDDKNDVMYPYVRRGGWHIGSYATGLRERYCPNVPESPINEKKSALKVGGESLEGWTCGSEGHK